MSVLLARKDKTSKSNWMRMIKANELIWGKYKPDAVLKAGRGWLIQTLDAIHIAEVLTENNIPFEKKNEHLIEID